MWTLRFRCHRHCYIHQARIALRYRRQMFHQSRLLSKGVNTVLERLRCCDILYASCWVPHPYIAVSFEVLLREFFSGELRIATFAQPQHSFSPFGCVLLPSLVRHLLEGFS